MKINKLIYIIIIIYLSISLTSCNFDANSTELLKKQKPDNFYYTNLLTRDIKFENSYLGIILDTNFYKEHTLSKDESDIAKNFILSLNTKSFVSKPNDLPEKPPYKIYFTFKTDKYVIEVFNGRYVSVYPWDGSYNKDYIDMSNTPDSYNLFLLCKYSIPRD